MKSLEDISWKVTEEKYRADEALSYSTLARFDREGFNNLDKLFDKRIYEVKDTKYVNLNGLKGKYTIYYRIDGKVYKTDYYIEV